MEGIVTGTVAGTQTTLPRPRLSTVFSYSTASGLTFSRSGRPSSSPSDDTTPTLATQPWSHLMHAVSIPIRGPLERGFCQLCGHGAEAPEGLVSPVPQPVTAEQESGALLTVPHTCEVGFLPLCACLPKDALASLVASHCPRLLEIVDLKQRLPRFPWQGWTPSHTLEVKWTLPAAGGQAMEGPAAEP